MTAERPERPSSSLGVPEATFAVAADRYMDWLEAELAESNRKFAAVLGCVKELNEAGDIEDSIAGTILFSIVEVRQ